VSALCVVPVELPESWGGFATNRGVVRFDGASLVIEFQTKDGMFEVWQSDIQRVTVPLPALTSFTWKSGWFGGRFDLAVASLELTRGLPGGDQGGVRLKVRRKDRPAAEQLADEVHLALANRVLDRIDSSDPATGEAKLRRHTPGTAPP
jgi:hypothetical protein